MSSTTYNAAMENDEIRALRYEGMEDEYCEYCDEAIAGDPVYIWWAIADAAAPYCRDCAARINEDAEFEDAAYERYVRYHLNSR